MLNELIITLIFRGIPEGFIHMYAMYTFSKVKIEPKKYFISSSILAGVMILISNLPISYGIHSILIVMAMINLSIIVNGLRPIYCISIAIINMMLQFLAEGVNVLLIQNVLGLEMASVMSHPLTKAISGLPSLIIFVGVIFLIGKVGTKRHRGKHVQYTKTMRED